jgi:hypothetical protein
VACLPDGDGHGEYWCAQLAIPVQRSLDDAPDLERYPQDLIFRDEYGLLLWVYFVVLHARDGQLLRPGMRGLTADVAYVVDLTLGYDTTLDPAKIDWVGVAEVDVSPEAAGSTSFPTDSGTGTESGADSGGDEVREPTLDIAVPPPPSAHASEPAEVEHRPVDSASPRHSASRNLSPDAMDATTDGALPVTRPDTAWPPAATSAVPQEIPLPPAPPGLQDDWPFDVGGDETAVPDGDVIAAAGPEVVADAAVSDSDDIETPAHQTVQDLSTTWAPPSDPARHTTWPSVTSPPPGSRPPAVTAKQFRQRLNATIAALAALAGQKRFRPDVPCAVEMKPGQPPPVGVPSYGVDPGELRYHTKDPFEGWVWRSTNDPDELLYWIIDDVARSVAWRWAQQAPSFPTMSPQQAQAWLSMPYWYSLVQGLNVQWGTRTMRRIEQILDAFPPSRD